VSEGAEVHVTFVGRPFQMRASAIGEALAATVQRRYDDDIILSVRLFKTKYSDVLLNSVTMSEKLRKGLTPSTPAVLLFEGFSAILV